MDIALMPSWLPSHAHRDVGTPFGWSTVEVDPHVVLLYQYAMLRVTNYSWVLSSNTCACAHVLAKGEASNSPSPRGPAHLVVYTVVQDVRTRTR